MITKLPFSFGQKPCHPKKGQGMTEYIILVTLIALSAIALVAIFGKQEKKQFAAMTQSLAGKDAVVDSSLIEQAKEEQAKDPSLTHYDQPHTPPVTPPPPTPNPASPPASDPPAETGTIPSDPTPPPSDPPLPPSAPPTPPTPTPPAPPPPTPTPPDPTPPAPPPPPPVPTFTQYAGHYTGSMFGYTITDAHFTTTNGQVQGYMNIKGDWGSIRQDFSGSVSGNTVNLQGIRITVIYLKPGVRYHPDNLTLTQNPDGSLSGGSVYCPATGVSSTVTLTRS